MNVVVDGWRHVKLTFHGNLWTVPQDVKRTCHGVADLVVMGIDADIRARSRHARQERTRIDEMLTTEAR
jgi:hypothetical protein